MINSRGLGTGWKHRAGWRGAVVEAFESRRLLSTIVVNTTADQTDAPGSGVVSFLDAIAVANASPDSTTTITFDPTVFASQQTIDIDNPIEIDASAGAVTINGPAARVNLSGNNTGGGIQIDLGATVTFTDLSIIDGVNLGDSGGIVNDGTLTINDCTLADNTSGSGGDVGNPGSGGAIDNKGILTMVNSTVSGNAALASTLLGPGVGGGLLNEGSAMLINDTFSGNTAVTGGGILNAGTLTIGNTIVAGDSAATSPDVSGAFTSLGNNLIGAGDDSSGWISSDIVGSAASPISADLGALADNGGPTQTMFPAAGSPAIGGGSVALIPAGVTTDQRGLPRTSKGAVDIGSVEVNQSSPGLASTAVSLDASTTSYTTGTTLTLTATVTSSVGTAPAGSVTFTSNSAALGTAQLSDGTAILTLTSLPVGVDAVAASYSGDNSFAASSSTATDITAVNPSNPSGPAGPAAVVIRSTIPTNIVDGRTVHSTVEATLTNHLTTSQSGSYTISIIASPTTSDGAGSQLLGHLKRSLKLASGKTVSLRLQTVIPVGIPAGVYHLLIQTADPAGDVTTVDTGATTIIAAPFVALSESLTDSGLNGVSGQPVRATARLVITNGGNVPFKGKTPIELSLADSAGGSIGSPVASITRNLSISAGRSVTLVIPIRALPALPAAEYWLLAGVTDPFDSAVNASVAESMDPIAVAAPVIALSAAFPRVTATTERDGAAITITNSGNVADVSKFTAVVGFATDAAGQNIVASGAGIVSVRSIRVRAGKRARLSVAGWKSLLATLPAGSYYLTVTLTDFSGNSAFAISGAAVRS